MTYLDEFISLKEKFYFSMEKINLFKVSQFYQEIGFLKRDLLKEVMEDCPIISNLKEDFKKIDEDYYKFFKKDKKSKKDIGTF